MRAWWERRSGKIRRFVAMVHLAQCHFTQQHQTFGILFGRKTIIRCWRSKREGKLSESVVHLGRPTALGDHICKIDAFAEHVTGLNVEKVEEVSLRWNGTYDRGFRWGDAKALAENTGEVGRS